MMMRVKYNNFYTPRFHRKNKSFSPALSSLVFDTRQNARTAKIKNQKKKWSHSLSGFYPNFTIQSKERARALDERHTRKEKHAFFFPLSISRLKRLDSKSSITTQTTTT